MQLFRYIFAPRPATPETAIAVHEGHQRLPYRWVLGVGMIALPLIYLAMVSHLFHADIPLQQQPVKAAVITLSISGLAFVYLAELLQFIRSGRQVMLTLLGAGLLLRVIMLSTTPVLEVDYNRYLWDGAVTASGLNPYIFSPDVVWAGQNIPTEYSKLAAAPGATIGSINHGYLRTIYPPLTQAAFALAYLLKPWSLFAWRIVLLLADIATLLLLFALLRQFDLSPLWTAIFWLNPLYIKEITNSAHMDALIFPFLTAALLLLAQRRMTGAVAFLALSAGVKLWTIALLPLFLREIGWHWRKLLAASAVFGGMLAALLLPMLLSGLDSQAGLAAYATRWELNDAAFQLIFWLSEPLVEFFGYHPGHAQQVSRWITAAILLLWTVTIFLKKSAHPRETIDHCLLVVAGIFLLSPTQFPWYATWLLPFLVVSPRKPLLWLTALLPLYYLWYYFEPRGQVAVFDNVIVWLEFVPVWLLIFREWRHNARLRFRN